VGLQAPRRGHAIKRSAEARIQDGVVRHGKLSFVHRPKAIAHALAGFLCGPACRASMRPCRSSVWIIGERRKPGLDQRSEAVRMPKLTVARNWIALPVNAVVVMPL